MNEKLFTELVAEQKRLEDLISKAQGELARIKPLIAYYAGGNGTVASGKLPNIRGLNVRASVRVLAKGWGEKFTSNQLFEILKDQKDFANEMALRNNIAVALKMLYRSKQIDRRDISTTPNLQKYEYWWIGGSSS